MYSKLVIEIAVLLLSIFFFEKCVSERIYYKYCDHNGFSCTLNKGKNRITYQCPATETDVTLYLWQFTSPSNIEALTVKNCTNLRLSFMCTGENKPINHLLLANITNLYIIRSTFTHNPQTIVLENIQNFEYIPENTFSQIKRRIPGGGCFDPAQDLQNLHFNRVNIGTVAPMAFNELKDFHNFSWNEVKVGRMQGLAIRVEFNKGGNFSVRRSNLEVCEHLAFTIVGPKALFVENKFIDIYSGAINGTISSFVFGMNTVNNLQAHSFSILSENVRISDNRFEYLRAGAFEKISPGVLVNQQINFGTLRFVYEFSHNSVNFVDAACLNPDVPTYDNVATDLVFKHNAFFCSCENLGWLFSEVGHGHNTAMLHDFYDVVTDEENKNMCSHTSCDLSLHKARSLLRGGKCLMNRTAENLCSAKVDLKRNDKTKTTKKWDNQDGNNGSQPQCVTATVIIMLSIIYFMC